MSNSFCHQWKSECFSWFEEFGLREEYTWPFGDISNIQSIKSVARLSKRDIFVCGYVCMLVYMLLILYAVHFVCCSYCLLFISLILCWYLIWIFDFGDFFGVEFILRLFDLLFISLDILSDTTIVIWHIFGNFYSYWF